MKKFQTLLNEVLESENLEEVEAGADLFQYGLDKGYYTRLEMIEFNKVFWGLKDKFLTQGIEVNFKNINNLDLVYIVSKAPVKVKEDKQQLITYVKGIMKNLRGKQRIA